MYEEFFGLSEKPFSIQPDPSFLYWGRGHRLAYAMLEYGVLNHAGISVITGEVGCGKTTLVHRLLEQLSDTHSVALLSNIQQGRGDLLSWVLMGFGQPFAGKTHVELFSQLQTFFISEYAKGRRTVLIIDEAQNLSIDMLEELRMLSNINAGKDQLLQLILVAQPQLKDLLNRPDMLQLAQRIGADFHLTPLSREEVDAYLDTRLSIAGARRRVFTDRAVDLIAEQSRGVPRVINIIADTALVYAFSAQDLVVDVETIRSVIRDKIDYGVFGLPTDADSVMAPGDAAGPTAFLKGERAEDSPRPRAPLRSAPPVRPPADAAPPRLAEAPDQPRMPAAARVWRPHSAQAEFAPSPDNLIEMLARAEPFEAPPQDEPAQPDVAADEDTMSAANDREAHPPAPPGDPAPATAPSAPEPVAQAGIVVIGAGGSPERTLRSIGDGRVAVFVAQSRDDSAAEAARRFGADIVEIADRALSPGRARNAGYRHLKKRSPNFAYVQFVETGVALDPDWLAVAMRFMERRPEVAAVEGVIAERPVAGSIYAVVALAADRPAGEIQTSGATVLVRAEAFEGAGGFRGDLIMNETQDLCIRLRRRGAIVWRLETLMGERSSNIVSFSDWWTRAMRAGFEYAHGAALHGGPPDRLYGAEQTRAIFWGALLPIFIVLVAGVGAVMANLVAPLMNPLIVIAVVLALGALVYFLKISVIAFRRGAGKSSSWLFALLMTVGHVPEFIGAWRYHFGGARAKQINRFGA